MNASSERSGEHKSALVSGRHSNKQAEEVLREYGKAERYIWNEKMLRTLVRGVKGRGVGFTYDRECQRSYNPVFAEHVLLSLKAIHREVIGLRNGEKH